jgi:hypothetical protein
MRIERHTDDLPMNEMKKYSNELEAKKRKENDKKRWQKNKEKYLKKVLCDCGVEIASQGMERHLHTEKHTKLYIKKLMEKKVSNE